jgi:hypothetical protein
MNNEFHKPFIKSLLLVAVVTVFAMVSSKYVIDFYAKHNISPSKTIEYSSQKSQGEIESALVE